MNGSLEFARLVLRAWWNDGAPGDVDGADLQEFAEKAGLWRCGGDGSPGGELTEAGMTLMGQYLADVVAALDTPTAGVDTPGAAAPGGDPMTHPSAGATSPCSPPHSGAGLAPGPAPASPLGRLLAMALIGLALIGCASGTVTTSTGAVVPAATVEAQDAVADALAGLSGVQAEAVKIHDSRVATDDPAEHAANRRTLLASYDALVAAWGALGTWKAASTGAAPASVLRPLAPALDSLLDLAARYGIVTPEQARAWRALVPRPVEVPVPKPVVCWCPHAAPTWCGCDPGSVVRIDSGPWVDGTNYHVRLGPNAWDSTAMVTVEVPR